MATLLSRTAWAKISVFRKKMAFFFSFKTYLYRMARIRNQRLRIDPCAKFQLHWTKDKGTWILTWNDTKNGLMTSYLPPSDDVSKIFYGFWEIFSRSTTMPSLVVIRSQIKEKQRGHNVPSQPIWFQKTPAWIGLTLLMPREGGWAMSQPPSCFSSITFVRIKLLKRNFG